MNNDHVNEHFWDAINALNSPLGDPTKLPESAESELTTRKDIDEFKALHTPDSPDKGELNFNDIQRLYAIPVNIPIRDYFAGQAINGVIMNTDFMNVEDEIIARYCYGIADAMLEERAK